MVTIVNFLAPIHFLRGSPTCMAYFYDFSLLLVVVYGKCAFPGDARGGSIKYLNLVLKLNWNLKLEIEI